VVLHGQETHIHTHTHTHTASVNNNAPFLFKFSKMLVSYCKPCKMLVLAMVVFFPPLLCTVLLSVHTRSLSSFLLHTHTHTHTHILSLSRFLIRSRIRYSQFSLFHLFIHSQLSLSCTRTRTQVLTHPTLDLLKSISQTFICFLIRTKYLELPSVVRRTHRWIKYGDK